MCLSLLQTRIRRTSLRRGLLMTTKVVVGETVSPEAFEDYADNLAEVLATIHAGAAAEDYLR